MSKRPSKKKRRELRNAGKTFQGLKDLHKPRPKTLAERLQERKDQSNKDTT
jgi:hypothetical protein